MKNTTIFISVIFSFLYTGCEKADLQNSTPNDTVQITNRVVDDCEDCPVDYCCCAIELYGFTDDAEISVCGFTNGVYLCGTFDPPGTCANLTAGGEDIHLLDPNNIRVLVCKEENGVFRIFNNESFQITIRITCQFGSTNPQWVVLTIPAHTEVFYSTNGQCGLTAC